MIYFTTIIWKLGKKFKDLLSQKLDPREIRSKCIIKGFSSKECSQRYLKWQKLLQIAVVSVFVMYGCYFFMTILEPFSARINFFIVTVLRDSFGQFGHIIQTLYSEFFALWEQIIFNFCSKKGLFGGINMFDRGRGLLEK